MQLQYNLQQPESFAGQIVDNRTAEVLTAAAGQDLSFGVPVYVSSWSESKPVVMLCDALTDLDKLFGVVVYEPRQRNTWPISYTAGTTEPTGTVIKKDLEIAILRKGALWTDYTAGAVTAGSVARLDKTTTTLGRFKTTAATTNDVTYYGLQFLSGGAAGTLQKLQVNLPSYFVKS